MGVEIFNFYINNDYAADGDYSFQAGLLYLYGMVEANIARRNI